MKFSRLRRRRRVRLPGEDILAGLALVSFLALVYLTLYLTAPAGSVYS